MRRSVLVVLLAVLAALVPVAAHAATDDTPDDVRSWYAEQAPEVVTSAAGSVLEVAAADSGRLQVGRPVVVTTWAPAFRDGEATSTVLVRLERWVAPVTLPPPPDAPEGEGEPEDLGVVFARRGEAGAVTSDGVAAEPELAAYLAAGSTGAVVHDEQTEGWFSYADGVVAPLTAAAREVLAGEVRVELYQPLLAERYAGPPVSVGGTSGGADDAGPPALWAAGVVLVVLVIAAVLVWLRREEDAEDDEPVSVGAAPR